MLVAALALGACSGSGDRPRPPSSSVPAPRPRLVRTLASCAGPSSDEAVTIRLAHVETDLRGELLAKLVAQFERVHPNIDVVVKEGGNGWEVLLDQWQEQTPADRAGLVMLPQQVSRRMADSGLTIAPDDCLREAVPDMLPAIEATWTLDGVLHAVPFAVSTPVFLYNRHVFEAGGLDPDDPPTTLAEMREVSEILVEAGVVRAGLVFDTGAESGASWFVEQWGAQLGELSLTQSNGRDGRPESVAWLDGSAVEHYRWIQEMHAAGLALSVGRNATGRQDLLEAIEPGELIAMTVHTCGSLGEVLDALVNFPLDYLDLAVAPFVGPGQGSVPGGSAFWITSGKPSVETAAAWQLASYLASAPVQAQWGTTGYVPISQTATTLEPLRSRWAEQPELAIAYDELARHGTEPVDLPPSAGPLPEIHKLLATALDDVLAGADPAAVLEVAADDARRLLAAYNTGAPS